MGCSYFIPRGEDTDEKHAFCNRGHKMGKINYNPYPEAQGTACN